MSAEKSELAKLINALEKINMNVVVNEAANLSPEDVSTIRELRDAIAENSSVITVNDINQVSTVLRILLARDKYNFKLSEEQKELLQSVIELLSVIRCSIGKILDIN